MAACVIEVAPLVVTEDMLVGAGVTEAVENGDDGVTDGSGAGWGDVWGSV